MPEIVLHFDSAGDAEAIAKQLQERAAELPGVAEAQAEASRSRGVTEIILILNVAVELIGTSASALDVVKRLIESGKGVWGALGLAHPRVEVGMRQIAPEALTAHHAEELLKA